MVGDWVVDSGHDTIFIATPKNDLKTFTRSCEGRQAVGVASVPAPVIKQIELLS